MLFEPGPWDNKEKCEGIHVFSKKRKLMYGEEHNAAAEAEEGEDYGQKELHPKHPMWRKKSLVYLQTVAARTTGEVRLERKVPRWNHKEDSAHVTGWPGDLGKSYALVEEFVELGVLSIHQNDNQSTYGVVHRKPLLQAAARFCTDPSDAPAASVAAGGAAPAGPVPAFEAAASFQGKRAGAAFKLGEEGLGYYRDASQPEAAEAAPAPLPADWTPGATPEGYAYYWHGPTGTSSWERPTAATQLVKVVPLSAEAVAALRGAGPSGMAKVQEATGCVVTLKAGQAAVSGTAEGIEHAATLLRRKAEGLLYAARAMPSARAPVPAAGCHGSGGSSAQQRKSEWDFRAVVAVRDAAVAEAPEGGGALAALAAYDDDDDDDDAE